MTRTINFAASLADSRDIATNLENLQRSHAESETSPQNQEARHFLLGQRVTKCPDLLG
jgi:hypothetical protein